MTERIPWSVFFGAGVLAVAGLAYAAYSRPGYFTNQTYLSGLVFLECMVAAAWMYRRAFFPVLLVTFLLAGINLSVGRGWASARWLVLGIGALAGLILVLKDRRHDFGLFHLVAFFMVLTAVISAAVSKFPDIALLKVFSLLLLFVYAATGARLAVIGREYRFFNALLVGCEIFVGLNAAFYAFGVQAMGNPNSLGAVMALAAPILLWGVLCGGERSVHQRRLFLYAICIGLAFWSHARAGIAAALLSSAVLCLAARKYKLLLQGITLLAIMAAAVALVRPNAVSSITSFVVYKSGPGDILASRISPWQEATDNILDHPWFGLGMGTTNTGVELDQDQRAVTMSGTATSEHGSSYLAIVAGVGVVGAIPTLILLLLLIAKVVRVLRAVHASGNVTHPATVLAMVVIAGIVHASFEDWMFAPGSYLCVFFWSLAFVFNDLVTPLPRVDFNWNLRATRAASFSRP